MDTFSQFPDVVLFLLAKPGANKTLGRFNYEVGVAAENNEDEKNEDNTPDLTEFAENVVAEVLAYVPHLQDTMTQIADYDETECECDFALAFDVSSSVDNQPAYIVLTKEFLNLFTPVHEKSIQVYSNLLENSFSGKIVFNEQTTFICKLNAYPAGKVHKSEELQSNNLPVKHSLFKSFFTANLNPNERQELADLLVHYVDGQRTTFQVYL